MLHETLGGRCGERDTSGVTQFDEFRPGDEYPDRQTLRGTFMRMLSVLVVALSVIALTACSGSGDDSGQPHRGQAGPYIGGSGGVGF
jgi:hypothetical protein